MGVQHFPFFFFLYIANTRRKEKKKKEKKKANPMISSIGKRKGGGWRKRERELVSLFMYFFSVYFLPPWTPAFQSPHPPPSFLVARECEYLDSFVAKCINASSPRG